MNVIFAALALGASFSRDLPAQDTAGGSRTITARRTAETIVLDGVLDERFWRTAEPADGFVQRELSEGEPATERTEVRVLYTGDTLYIGVICFDREPERILHKEMSRDADLGSDDSFTMVIDTFSDRRNGYFFQVNPNGARNDALVFGGDHDHSWNGVWDTAARITGEGWSAEMAIPFKTFRFGAGETQSWGINFRRNIRRKNEEVLWTAWGRNDGIFQLSKFGRLEGIAGVRRSRTVDFKPYALGGMEKVRMEDLDRTGKIGLDVKVPVTSDLTLDLTSFTDFAQVESDREQINLTRFDINYPEKREFFLEGADIFTFGSPVTTPFYSRRIGLTPDRRQVPIVAGAKLVGRAGAYTIGVIDMQTADKDSFHATNYSVVRIKRDVFEKSTVGFIVTNASSGGDGSGGAYGADFLFRTDRFLSGQNLQVGGYLAADRDPEGEGSGSAGRIFVQLPNDTYSVSLLYHAVGANYNPETGFVRRRNIRQHQIQIDYTPRIPLPGVKKLLFMPIGLNYYTDSGSRLLTRTMNVRPFGVAFNSGDQFEVNIYGSYENVEKEFERFRGKMKVPAGIYRWWDCEIEFESAETRPVTFDIHAHRGDFYQGKNDNISSSLGFKVSKYYSLSADVSYQHISMNGGIFEVRDFGGSLGINFSTRLTAGTLVQYNNESGEVNMNFRLHYIPKIGSDVYFVYNHLWDEEDRFRTLQNTGVFKIAYLLQF